MHPVVGMRALARRHRVLVFVAITFAVSWSAWLSLAATGHTVGAGFSPLYLLGLLGPLIGAVITTALVGRGSGMRALFARMIRVRAGTRAWGLALLPIAIAIVAHLVLVFYSMFLLAPVHVPTWRTLGQFTGFPVMNAALLAVLLVLVNGYGEETGWRGFLLPTLQRRFSPVVSAVLVAIVWAAWHAPAFLINENYRQMPAAMVPVFFVGLACGSLLLTYLYNHGRRSIFIVALWHGLFNLVTGTVAAAGILAAIETTAVMVIALAVLVHESRTRHDATAARSIA